LSIPASPSMGFINPHLCTDTVFVSCATIIAPSHKAQRTAPDQPQAKNSPVMDYGRLRVV
jgi:hypothetical protein